MSEILTTLFSADIQPVLQPNNEFYSKAKVDPASTKYVEVPNSGANSTVNKNPSSLPLTIAPRTDDKVSYTIEQYITDPTLITNVNELQISYDKRADIISSHAANIKTRVANEVAYTWATDTHLVRTSGSSVSTALAPGATSTRKALTAADIISADALMTSQDIPMEGRFMLIPAYLYAQMLSISDFISADKMGYIQGEGKLASGAIGKVLGFTVFVRSATPVYATGGTKKAVGATAATGDHLSILCWNERFVRYAQTPAKAYVSLDRPEYGGSIFNCEIMAGGAKSRVDEKGVVSIVQAA